MRYDPENIESKLIPYLEGVLNAKERREVDEAIGQDGELAREMSELREVILELRQGFASGLKPPQEELSVEEVVELGFNTGTIDGLPGTSEQKARLFCSDNALEEYALLRALAEELQKTSIDRENVPEMPADLRNEFLRLKSAPRAPKLLPFVRRLSPVPAWRSASGVLDRINPRPLMASAAALVLLSFGVHLYNQPTMSTSGESPTLASAANNFDENGDASAGMGGTAPPGTTTAGPPPVEASGVAVFTSDDRSLLKEQAEKLLAKKLRYTVTQDRILVADKDVDEARGILWDDAEGKAVAVATESSEQKQIKRGTASNEDSDSTADTVSEEAATVNVDQALDEAAGYARSGREDVTFYPSRSAAPAKPTVPEPPVASSARPAPRPAVKEIPTYRSTSSSSNSSGRKGSTGILTGYASSGASSVRKPAAAGEVIEGAPAPTRVEPTEDEAPMTEERRQKLKDMALGADRSSSESGRGSSSDDGIAREERAPTPSTVVLSRARVAATAPAPQAASAPVANVVTRSSSSSDASKKAEAEVSSSIPAASSRVASIEQSRSGAARRLGVDLSIESQGDRVTVYVRSKKSRSKAELDELRRAVRQELGLSESDTIILR